MRLIDGDALIAWIKESQHMTSKMRNVICKVETMPTADRPQGEWIITESYQKGQIIWCDYKCSICGHHRDRRMNYCEICGARMIAKNINAPNKKGAE